MCRKSLLNTRSKDIGRGIIMACSGGMEGKGGGRIKQQGKLKGNWRNMLVESSSLAKSIQIVK